MSNSELDLEHENERLRAALADIKGLSKCEFARSRAAQGLNCLPSRSAWVSWQVRKLEIKHAQEQALNEQLTDALATTMAMIGYVRDKRITADDAWGYVNSQIGSTRTEPAE